MVIVEIIKAILIMVTVSTLIVLACVLIALIPISFRIYRLKKLADTFGLGYSSNFKYFRESELSKYERNVLYGVINGQTVRIYDLYDDKYWPPPSFFEGSGPVPRAMWTFGRRMTVLEFNWAKPDMPLYFLKDSFFGIRGLASLRLVRQLLDEIKERGADVEILSYARKQAPKVTRIMYLAAILAILIFFGVFLQLTK